jgi:hypothetical protein
MSDTSTTEVMNEVIARFMGGEVKDDYTLSNYTKIGIPDWAFRIHNFDVIKVGGYEYHTSWDWLMPVIEKIETPQFDEKGQFIFRSNADVGIHYKACVVEYVPDEESGDTTEEVKIQTQSETKLEAVYKAVYQFIQWYNQNKNQ